MQDNNDITHTIAVLGLIVALLGLIVSAVAPILGPLAGLIIIAFLAGGATSGQIDDSSGATGSRAAESII